MRDLMMQVVKAYLDHWIDRIFDFFCRTQRPAELPEDTYAREQEAQHYHDLYEFDKLLKAECKIDYLPWEQRPSTTAGTWNQLFHPGLAAALQGGMIQGDRILSGMIGQMHQPATHEEAMQMQLQAMQAIQAAMNQRTGIQDQQFAQQCGLSNLQKLHQQNALIGTPSVLEALLGSQSRPSRPE